MAEEAGSRKDNKRKHRDAKTCNNEKKAPGEEEVEAAEDQCEYGGDGGLGGSFVCQVVPLSLALHQLGIPVVDLLKVDVEGDELAVLQGIDDEDWPKIHQVRMVVRGVWGKVSPRAHVFSTDQDKCTPMTVYIPTSRFDRCPLSFAGCRSCSRCMMSTGG